MAMKKFYKILPEYGFDTLEELLIEMLSINAERDYVRGLIKIVNRRESYIDVERYSIKINVSGKAHITYIYTKGEASLDLSHNDSISENTEASTFMVLDSSEYKGFGKKGPNYIPGIEEHKYEEFEQELPSDVKLLDRIKFDSSSCNSAEYHAIPYNADRDLSYASASVTERNHIFVRVPVYEIEYECYGKIYSLAEIPLYYRPVLGVIKPSPDRPNVTAGMPHIKKGKKNGEYFSINFILMLFGLIGIALGAFFIANETISSTILNYVISALFIIAGIVGLALSIRIYKKPKLDVIWHDIYSKVIDRNKKKKSN